MRTNASDSDKTMPQDDSASVNQRCGEDVGNNVVRETYRPAQDRLLTDAILDAIKNCKGDDLLRTDFDLYEDINPDALDSLFRNDALPRTRVAIKTDGVRIELWGDDGVQVRVEDSSAR